MSTAVQTPVYISEIAQSLPVQSGTGPLRALQKTLILRCLISC